MRTKISIVQNFSALLLASLLTTGSLEAVEQNGISSPETAQSEDSKSVKAAEQAIQAVISSSRAEADQLETRLKTASPEQRNALVREMRAKQKAHLEAMRSLRATLPPIAKLTEEQKIKRIEKTASPEMKAALLERQKLAADFTLMREQAKTMPPKEGSVAITKWIQRHRQQSEEITKRIKSGLVTVKAGKPAPRPWTSPKIPEDLPESLKAKLAARYQLLGELDQLKRQFRNAPPNQLAAATAQWSATNRGRMKAAVPSPAELKQVDESVSKK